MKFELTLSVLFDPPSPLSDGSRHGTVTDTLDMDSVANLDEAGAWADSVYGKGGHWTADDGSYSYYVNGFSVRDPHDDEVKEADRFHAPDITVG